MVSIEKGSYVKCGQITLAEWLDDWIEGYVRMHCSPKTVASYQSEVHLHLMPALGRIPLAKLQAKHLQNYYAGALSQGRVNGKGGLSAQTVLYHHRILFEALGHAVRQGLLGRNVAQAVYPPRPVRSEMATLTAEQVAKFLDAAQETPYYGFFYTLLHTGLRRGELLALRWRNVDLDLASLSVTETLYRLSGKGYITKPPKTRKSRRKVALFPSLALFLREHRENQKVQRLLLGKPLTDDDFVFARPDGTPLHPDTVTHAFAGTIRRAGLPHVRLHDLRHTHATMLLKANIHPRIVQERLGHASVATTLDLYSHVLPGMQEMAGRRFEELLEAWSAEECRQDVGKGS